MRESILLRRPLLRRDGAFATYAFSTAGRTADAPYERVTELPGMEDRPLFVADAPGEWPSRMNGGAGRTVVAVGPDGMARIAPLKALGFQVSVRLATGAMPAAAELGAADYVWWDTADGLETIARISARLRGKPVASGVSSRDSFEKSRELGAQLFEGEWYRQVESTAGRTISPAQSTILELMNQLQREAPVAQIELLLKRDASLSFRLLRYINSAGFGLSCEINSFRHAVTILGYQNLARWLALLLATAGSSPTSPTLMREAAVRGRLAELVGADLVQASERDNLFICGVFSLLPAILQLPMGQLLEQLNLAEPVTDALLYRQGVYGPILRLAESVEGEDAELLLRLCDDLQTSPEQLNAHHLTALGWAASLQL